MKAILARKRHLLRDWVGLAMERVELAHSQLKTSFKITLAAR
jgi:hypothetical protein